VSSSSDAKPTITTNKSSRRPRKNNKRKRAAATEQKQSKNLDEVETWRVYGIDVDPDALGTESTADTRKEQNGAVPPERQYLTPPVVSALLSRLRIRDLLAEEGAESEEDASSSQSELKLPPELKDARVVRRSIDARKRRGKSSAEPKYAYVVDVDITKGNVRKLRFIGQPGRMERLENKENRAERAGLEGNKMLPSEKKPKIIIVGAGPAGLFCALSLASSGLFTPIVLERGQPVEARGKSIGALIHRRSIDPESNFSFGEGGAGTWSDGKLTTRIGRNSGPVRFVLETLVKYGAPQRILVEGAPHLGTDNLVRLLRNMREDLRKMGGEVHFGNRASKFHIENGIIKGVDAECTEAHERHQSTGGKFAPVHEPGTTATFMGDAVVLATGHSARDVYEKLHEEGVELEAKGFAVGFRIEHPQKIINEIQYGKDWGGRVLTRRPSTDVVNAQHFSKYATDATQQHEGTLPVASYRLATNQAFDGEINRGAYSFCMCPGGQIVPSSTEDGELCINGMSFSNRDSLWANSALVVTVNPDDPILHEYRQTHGTLAGLHFQKHMERKACEFGGGDMTVPVQRLTDFVRGELSSTVPASSYRLGTKSAPLHDIYPKPLYNSFVHAIINHFDKQMPGFLCDEALVHGVETRTSSPLRVLRDANTLKAIGVDNLFPTGEGAGFAGGIVSAAVDGLIVAEAIKTNFFENPGAALFTTKKNSVGFEY